VVRTAQAAKGVSMKSWLLAASLAFALASLASSGMPPPASADSCRHTDVVFYSTDSNRLAQRLHAAQSACAGYFISTTPAGDLLSPRSNIAPPIRANGPEFHAMPEFRLDEWAKWVAANPGKTWFDAGVEFRRRMVTAGFDVSKGDTWIVNEVGEPTAAAKGVAVIKGTGTARADVRQVVQGLYTGDVGMPPAPGAVFAADPVQVTTDLAQYEQDLRSWYADEPFWQDMKRYVRFWAQETYADAHAWGVAGSTLEQRSAYLNDYFLHGRRLAAAGDGSTEAARAFFAAAYTPLGSAAFRWSAPTPPGPWFGYTDISLTGMQNFVSTQTYALRSSTPDRFGFAVVPRSATAAETTAVEDRLAAAIQGSEGGGSGACGASGEWCDGTVDGAQFNDAWKVFANTLEGANVRVQIGPGVTVTYTSVDARGATEVTASGTGFLPPAHFQLRPGTLFYDISTTAAYTGPVGVCLAYDAATYAGYAPHVFTFTDGRWKDITTTVGDSTVCGSAASLGTFAVFAGDPTPPTIVPHVDGPLGNDGWYTGDVTVPWDVADPQSPGSIVTAGCNPRTIDADTAGTTVTCTATSDGGTASRDVTVKRDATPPTATCDATPSSLWPPNGRLVPVAVAVAVADATSGPGALTLTQASTSIGDTTSDIVGFDVGTADIAGLLRAERPGTARERVYSLTYSARDAAGNAATCVATVVVPHDQRS
jgi:hypothetical protein